MTLVQRLGASLTIASLIAVAIALQPLPTNAAATGGSLIMCPDYPAVYYLADDNTRLAFPDERVYFSYYENFDDVKVTSCDRLGEVPLVGNVPYRAGTRLIKLESVNTVYVVEPGGVLRALISEDQAHHLYGENWTDEIDIVSDALFGSSYTIGEPVDSGEIPEGTIMREDETGWLYIVDKNNVAVLLGTAEEAAEQYPVFDSFLVPSSYILNGVQVNYERNPPESYIEELLNRARPLDVPVQDIVEVNVPELSIDNFNE